MEEEQQQQGETPQQSQQPQGLDPGLEERLGALMQDRLQAGLHQYRQQEEAVRQQAEQQRQAEEQRQKDTFGQLLAPYLNPQVQQMQFKSDDTKDYVDFYLANPGAQERRDTIEAQFQQMAQQGRAIPRADINAWLIGREQIQKDRQAAEAAALKSSTLHGGVGQREVMINKDPYEMTQEERAAFLSETPF